MMLKIGSFQSCSDVANRVARLEQARALNHHQRRRAAEVEAGRDLPRFALAADAHEARPSARSIAACHWPIVLSGTVTTCVMPSSLEELGDLFAGEESCERIAQFAFGPAGVTTRCSMKNSIMRC